MSDYLEIDQWNPPSECICQVRADDACRNCGELGHWAYQCTKEKRDVPGRFFQRRFVPRNRRNNRNDQQTGTPSNQQQANASQQNTAQATPAPAHVPTGTSNDPAQPGPCSPVSHQATNTTDGDRNRELLTQLAQAWLEEAGIQHPLASARETKNVDRQRKL